MGGIMELAALNKHPDSGEQPLQTIERGQNS